MTVLGKMASMSCPGSLQHPPLICSHNGSYADQEKLGPSCGVRMADQSPHLHSYYSAELLSSVLGRGCHCELGSDSAGSSIATVSPDGPPASGTHCALVLQFVSLCSYPEGRHHEDRKWSSSCPLSFSKLIRHHSPKDMQLL